MNQREYESVHDAHCCKEHGCKYSYGEARDQILGVSEVCPVVAGTEEGVRCEICYENEQNPAFRTLRLLRDVRRLLAEGKPTPSAETVLRMLLKELGDA